MEWRAIFDKRHLAVPLVINTFHTSPQSACRRTPTVSRGILLLTQIFHGLIFETSSNNTTLATAISNTLFSTSRRLMLVITHICGYNAVYPFSYQSVGKIQCERSLTILPTEKFSSATLVLTHSFPALPFSTSFLYICIPTKQIQHVSRQHQYYSTLYSLG